MPSYTKDKAKTYQEKQDCMNEKTRKKVSLTRSRRTEEPEPGCVMGESIVEVENSVNDVTSELEEAVKVNDETFRMENRATVSSKKSYGNRVVRLPSEKAENQKGDELQKKRTWKIAIRGTGQTLTGG